MSVESERGEHNLICDVCHYRGEIHDAHNFRTMIDEAKEEGWGFQRSGDTWQHACPNCSVDDLDQPESPLERAKRMFGRK